MATVNLGRIKPVFRGAYSGGTAYVVDDIVTSGGSSYICIQAHGAGTQAVTQTAYWSVLAQTGTDVGTTLTTQGDILYRDGSGLQRLAKGTAAQQLAMNAGATAPEWINASSDYVKLGTATLGSDAATLSIDGFFDAAYRRYDIEWQIQTDNSSSSNHLAMRFNTGGSANSGTYYTYGLMHHGNNNSGGFHDARGNLGNSSWGKQNMFRLGNTWQEHELPAQLANRGIMNLYQPQSSTMWKQCTWTTSIGSDNSAWTAGGTGHAIWHDATALTGVSFILQNGGDLKSGSTAIMYGVK